MACDFKQVWFIHQVAVTLTGFRYSSLESHLKRFRDSGKYDWHYKHLLSGALWSLQFIFFLFMLVYLHFFVFTFHRIGMFVQRIYYSQDQNLCITYLLCCCCCCYSLKSKWNASNPNVYTIFTSSAVFPFGLCTNAFSFFLFIIESCNTPPPFRFVDNARCMGEKRKGIKQI